jgi:TfoX/Sxy family transcriptional regulator of competence genes
VAYDEGLADRIREQFDGVSRVTEKRMFGGLAFLVNGNMAVAAASQGGLLLRVDPAETEALAAEPGAGRFVMRGREMNGWLHVEADAGTPDAELNRWVGIGIRYAGALPPKG